jgi:hypothetical protein
MFSNRFDLNHQQRKLWRNFSFGALGALALLFLMEGSAAVDRLALYLIPLQLTILSYLPRVFAVRGQASGAMVICVIAYSALIQFVWLNYATHSEYWLPYQFYPLVEET